MRLGPDVVPLLDKLGPPTDPEVRRHVEQIRYALVGFLNDIRCDLEAMPDVTDDVKPDISRELKAHVVGHQPRSGDFLILHRGPPRHRLHRRAVNAFVHSRHSMTAEQLDAYFRHTIVLTAVHREGYPQGVDAAIGMGIGPRYGWGGWLAGDGFRFTMRTTHFLDGKPYGRPYTYPGPMATTGWLSTKDLALGKHSCALEVEYELTRQDKKHTGRLRSAEFTFTMVPSDTPDDLAAPADADTDRVVQQAPSFAERESAVDLLLLTPGFTRLPPEKERSPQVSWSAAEGRRRAGRGELGRR